jgi:molecular chaperone GrpE
MTDEEDRIDDDEEDSVEEASSGNGKDDEEIYIKVIDVDDPYGETSENSSSKEVEVEASSVQIAELEKQLIDLKREKDDVYDRLLRKHADFENFRKRTEKDKRDYMSYALSEFMVELLPILDNFERAMAHADDQAGAEYRKGVQLIYRQFRDLLEKKGLRPIETAGQPFDPNYHEAIGREEHPEVPENTILEEFQKGYFFRDKLLRPALVKVSYQPSGSAVDAEEEIENAAPDKTSDE